MNATTARRRLRAIGARRKRWRKSGERLAEDTEQVLRETRDVVPVTEAAKLADIHRTTAHEYLKARN